MGEFVMLDAQAVGAFFLGAARGWFGDGRQTEEAVECFPGEGLGFYGLGLALDEGEEGEAALLVF